MDRSVICDAVITQGLEIDSLGDILCIRHVVLEIIKILHNSLFVCFVCINYTIPAVSFFIKIYGHYAGNSSKVSQKTFVIHIYHLIIILFCSSEIIYQKRIISNF